MLWALFVVLRGVRGFGLLGVCGPVVPFAVWVSDLGCRVPPLGWVVGRWSWILGLTFGGTDLGSCNHSQVIWRLILVFMRKAHCRKSLVSVFQEFFASVNKIFVLAGGSRH